MAIYMWREHIPQELCFTANTAGSTVKLSKQGSPTSVTLETSTDGNTWSTYTIGNTITLSNVGDKVYFRNTSDTTTNFSVSSSSYYYFSISGSAASSGNVTSLINKNCTDTLTSYCFGRLFWNCTNLTASPSLLANNLAVDCYSEMFRGCSNLETLPQLPAITLRNTCYYRMFYSCSKIKLSSSQTGEYQTPYRIPITGTGTTASNSLAQMFTSTGGTFTSNPSINTTYYTSNQVI